MSKFSIGKSTTPEDRVKIKFLLIFREMNNQGIKNQIKITNRNRYDEADEATNRARTRLHIIGLRRGAQRKKLCGAKSGWGSARPG